MTDTDKEITRRDFVADAGTLALGAVVAPHLRLSSPRWIRGGDPEGLPSEPSGTAASRSRRTNLFATDTFTDTNGRLRSAHVADAGEAWTKHPSSHAAGLVINGNHAEVSTASTSAFSRYTLGVDFGEC